ncbi:MAG: flippase-like domain-containing protein [Acidobacteriota bacterium]|nr:flippase-like domain-containing protein [Acidobacteriota bacterium]
MNLDTNTQNPITTDDNRNSQKNLNRLKIVAVVFTVLGAALFTYFIYSVGLEDIVAGIVKIGFGGFLFIQFLYLLRITVRAAAWSLSVSEPYKLDVRDTLPAVIIGEALSSLIPLGILVSGTAKAVAVKKRVPLVVGFSSIATENLFYSFITGLFVCLGAFAFLRSFDLAQGWIWTIDTLIAIIFLLITVGVLMIVRQWHWASNLCNWLYNRGVGTKFLESGRAQVRQFEGLIYGFYRQYPRRFAPIILFQITYHLIGIFEVWFILSRISEVATSVYTSFLLESISRAITIVFKLIPFLVGVDEAGAQFVSETLALGAGVGVTVAIIRKGRILFWTAVGLILIVKRELSFSEITKIRREEPAAE